MPIDVSWKSVSEQTVAAVLGATILGIGGVVWNWASSGDLVRLLGGVPPNEITDEVAKQITGYLAPITTRLDALESGAQQRQRQAYEITITNAFFEPNPSLHEENNLQLRKYLQEKCNTKPRCDIDTTDRVIYGMYLLYTAISVAYTCGDDGLAKESKEKKGPVLILSCLSKS